MINLLRFVNYYFIYMEKNIYTPKNKVRIVTAAALFDGHDAAINIMRRIIQSTGCEVVHLGHDKSVEDVVNTAIQEDANAIAMTSYQGGHNEYFKYMYDLLQEKGAGHIKIVGGGGGVILPSEIKELMDYGITRIYSPDDGRERSEEHTSELQSRPHIVCRLLFEKKNGAGAFYRYSLDIHDPNDPYTTLPFKTWIRLIVYLDYTNKKAYIETLYLATLIAVGFLHI